MEVEAAIITGKLPLPAIIINNIDTVVPQNEAICFSSFHGRKINIICTDILIGQKVNLI